MKKEYMETFWYWVKMMIVAGVLVFLIRGFLFIPMSVQGKSMEKTLHQDDQIVYEKYSKIKRFDVVVFQMKDGTTYIKRVIGLPNEHIEYKDDELYVEGEKIEEDFLGQAKIKRNSNQYTTNFDSSELSDKKKIGKHSYFVLGDNRRLSKDSRSFGEINEKNIVGKARMVYYPFKHAKIIK